VTLTVRVTFMDDIAPPLAPLDALVRVTVTLTVMMANGSRSTPLPDVLA